MAKAKLFYVRHQAAGVVIAHAFTEAPSPLEVAVVIDECDRSHGKTHPKTGEPYWAKVVSLFDGVEETVACAHGETVESVNARAMGFCPIREAGFERWPDADPEFVVHVMSMSEDDWKKNAADKRVVFVRPEWREEDTFDEARAKAFLRDAQAHAVMFKPGISAHGNVRNPGE